MIDIRIKYTYNIGYTNGDTMGKTKPYKEVIRVMKESGWVLDHTSGSHEIYVKDGHMCPVKCTKKDIPSGTLTNIERITGLKF